MHENFAIKAYDSLGMIIPELNSRYLFTEVSQPVHNYL